MTVERHNLATLPGRRRTAGFSLIELLVVIGIILLLLAVAIPSVTALTRGSSVKQAKNMVSAYVATARATAMANKRQAAVIFYEESGTYTNATNKNQTAVMIAIEDADQSKYTVTVPGGTVFIPWRTREYLPVGVRVSTLTSDVTTVAATTQNAAVNYRTRAIVFNADGQLVLRTGLVCAFDSAATKDAPTFIVGDWNFVTLTGVLPGTSTAATSSSSPGVLVYEGVKYDQANLGNDAARVAWLQKNADVIVVNAYTGTLLQ